MANAPKAADVAAAQPTVDGDAGVPHKRVPDFFIVGHEKCGTTALYEMVNRHPQVFMPSIKEPRFFAPELRSRFRRLSVGKLPETLDAYLELFAPAAPGQRAGEASPLYLRSREAACRIAQVQPDARIVAILREPASFLRSFHIQAVHNNVETETDFAKAIGLEEARRRGKRIPPFSQAPASLLYSDHVRYVEQLRRFHAAFPPEQVLVLIYEEFRDDNVAGVREVLRFLDVDDSLPIETIKTKPLQAVRSVPLFQLASAMTVARRRAAASGRALKALEARAPRPLNSGRFGTAWRNAVYRDAPLPDDAFMRTLRRRFKPEVEALSQYMNRDLVTFWGYADVG